MTRMYIEVGRRHGTTVKEVVDGLVMAGCMKDIEIDPKAHGYMDAEALRKELERYGFYVEEVSWPEPPPLPWWRRALYLPKRIYYWARRVFLRETFMDQWLRITQPSSEKLHALSMRESPMLKMRDEKWRE